MTDLNKNRNNASWYGSVNVHHSNDLVSDDLKDLEGIEQSDYYVASKHSPSYYHWRTAITVAFSLVVSYFFHQSSLQSNANSNPNSSLGITEKKEHLMTSIQIDTPIEIMFRPLPFSTVDPTSLHVHAYDRPAFSAPGKVFGALHGGQYKTGVALPTNKWYENMLLMPDEQTEPIDDNRVYTVPYVINACGKLPGINVFGTKLLGMDRVIQVTFVDKFGINLGVANELSSETISDQEFESHINRKYLVDSTADDLSGELAPLSPLGLTLKWESKSMVNESNETKGTELVKLTSSLVRGMPYATMHYHYANVQNDSFGSVLPTVVSYIAITESPLIDGTNEKLSCNKDKESFVQKSVKLQ